jgi:hypothetical protein
MTDENLQEHRGIATQGHDMILNFLRHFRGPMPGRAGWFGIAFASGQLSASS